MEKIGKIAFIIASLLLGVFIYFLLRVFPLEPRAIQSAKSGSPYSQYELAKIYLGGTNYEGETLLCAKNGSLVKTNMKQVVHYDVDEAISGCSAIIEVVR